jgi:hypothetical protein
MHEPDAYSSRDALRSLQMKDEETLLWATLRMLGDADCAAGLATTPKVWALCNDVLVVGWPCTYRKNCCTVMLA